MNAVRSTIIALTLCGVSLASSAQSYKQMHEHLFCNTIGQYAAQAAIDYYRHLPIDQALRSADDFVCTDHIRQVCEVRVRMIQDEIRSTYDVAKQIHMESMAPDHFSTIDGVVRSDAASACWQGAREHYGW